jgi:transcription elongation factor Elf1
MGKKCSKTLTLDVHKTYVAHCVRWQQQRKEEFLVYQQSQERSCNRLQQIWNYFDRSDEKCEVVCKACKVIVTIGEGSLAGINAHIEQIHPDIYEQFLTDTTGFRVATHSDIAGRTCSVCQKIFKSRSSMLDHTKIVHYRVHPYQCHVCGKTFARSSAYLAHHHIAVKKFLCTHCGKIFTTSHGRRKHERTHFVQNPAELATEICKICGKGFAFKENRLRHEKIHTGEKPFHCHQCDKQFSQKVHLQTHIRTHTGETPYACQNCNLKFKFISTRNKHSCEGKRQRLARAQPLSEDESMAPNQDEDSAEGWE